MENEGAQSEANMIADAPEYVDIHMEKGGHFRVIHVDGAIGGMTASGFLSATIYNERNTIPKHTRRPIQNDGDRVIIGPEETVDGKTGIYRQLEATLLMDLPTAKEFYDWLGRHLRATGTIDNADGNSLADEG